MRAHPRLGRRARARVAILHPMLASASAQGYDKIGPTAHVTAYAWYQLGLPYSHLFATREGAAMYWSFRALTEAAVRSFGLPNLLDYLEFRHRMLGVQLERLAPDRVVELGAGLSHRGLSWALDRGVSYVEIDLPHMSAAKRARIEAAPAHISRALREGTLELRTSDILSPSFALELRALVAGAKRPVVVSEGMLDYFSLEDRERLATNLAKGLLDTGGHYLTDTQRGDRERRVAKAAKVFRAAIKLATWGQGPARPFTNLDHIQRMFALAGFDEGRELAPKQLAADEPRLYRLRSPTTIWLARVGG